MVVVCVALFTRSNSNATFALPAPPPLKSHLLSPKIWVTRDQPGQVLSSSEERRKKSLRMWLVYSRQAHILGKHIF
jgi:hypothetical protein